MSVEGGSSRRRALVVAGALWLAAAVALPIAHVLASSGPVVVAAPGRLAGEPPQDETQKPAREARRKGSEDRKRDERRSHRRKHKRLRKAVLKRARRAQARAARLGKSLPLPPRLVPTYKLDNPHHDYPALDVLVRKGAPVLAITEGKVREVLKRGACGRGVIIKDPRGLTFTYCHGSKIAVREGARVQAGEVILKSGNSGRSTAPHVHVQVQTRGGRLLCPQHLLQAWARGKRLPAGMVGRRACVR